MLRRDFLKLSGVGLTGIGILGSGGMEYFGGGGTTFGDDANSEDKPIYAGWIDSPVARQRFIRENDKPFLSQMNEQIRGTGEGKVVCLWPYLEKSEERKFTPHNQELGDCVSHAYGLGVDVLTATQNFRNIVPQRWVAESSTEIIYGGGRRQTNSVNYGRGDGMNGVDAAAFVNKYGVLLRQKYLNGKYDFSIYSGQIARNLGTSGVPVELLPLCRLHPVQTVSLVKSWEECRDAVANGYPVTMCSNVGFSTRGGRDRDGFLSPGRQPWHHAMLIAGIDDSFKRPGGLIINSWGDWIDGPTRLNQPTGSFWADASVINRAMRQSDSIALSNYAGYPLQDLDYRFF